MVATHAATSADDSSGRDNELSSTTSSKAAAAKDGLQSVEASSAFRQTL